VRRGDLEADGHRGGVRVLHDVRERLRDDAVRRHLDRGRELRDVVGGHRHGQPGGGAVGLLPDRPDEPDLVEGGRAEPVHEATYLPQHAAHLVPRRGQRVLRRSGVRGHDDAGQVDA
jgi:hypothetical protein